MNPKAVSFAALAVSMLAGLCFVAGAFQFVFPSRDMANFAGIAMGTLAAILWIGAGMLRSKETTAQPN